MLSVRLPVRASSVGRCLGFPITWGFCSQVKGTPPGAPQLLAPKLVRWMGGGGPRWRTSDPWKVERTLPRTAISFALRRLLERCLTGRVREPATARWQRGATSLCRAKTPLASCARSSKATVVPFFSSCLRLVRSSGPTDGCGQRISGSRVAPRFLSAAAPRPSSGPVGRVPSKLLRRQSTEQLQQLLFLPGTLYYFPFSSGLHFWQCPLGA